MTNELLAPVFAQHVNTKFRAPLDDAGSIDFELTGVEPRFSPNGYECFSLLFRAPGDAPVAQGSYALTHEVMGDLDIFLVPIGRESDGIMFEAVFNRKISEPREVPVS